MTTNDETTEPIDALEEQNLGVIEGEIVPDHERVPIPTAEQLAESPGETTETVEQVVLGLDATRGILVTSEFLDTDPDAPHIAATSNIRAAAVATAGDLRRRGHTATARQVMLASLEQQADLCGIPTVLSL